MGDLGFLRDTAFWYTPHLKDGRPMRHDVALLAADRIAELEAVNQSLVDEREYWLEQYQVGALVKADAEIMRLRELLNVAVCPHCTAEGAFAAYNGEPSQCQFCAERDAALREGK